MTTGRRNVWRPRKIWVENVESDMTKLEIDREDIHYGEVMLCLI